MSGRVLGAVLAGGASSRFGSDKAAALLGGRTLLEHAQATLARVTDEVVVVGRPGGVPDRPVPGLGPLGGIAGALDHAGRRGFASVLTIGCDMVDVPGELLADLLAEVPSYCEDAPVLGHWPVSLTSVLLARLASIPASPRPCAGVHGHSRPDVELEERRWMPGQARHDDGGEARHRRDGVLSVRRWAASIGAAAVPSPYPLRNINTPADLIAS